MTEDALDAVGEALEAALIPLGFEAVSPPAEVVRAWVRKTWNTNRGVVLIDAPSLAEWVACAKIPVGKALGYFPLFYGMRLQVVCVSPGAPTEQARLGPLVDKIDNQRCIVQSVFTLDPVSAARGEARTWGQALTGRYQDAIARALAR